MFQAPRSTVDLSFWEALHQIKLDKQKLESPFVNITGTLKPAGDRAGFGGSISVDGTSFDSHDPGRSLCAPGACINVNTIEEFQRLNKKALVDCAGRHVWHRILDGSALSNPSNLFSFLMIVFADLKKHVFTYWFAFPALVPACPFSLAAPAVRLKDMLSVPTASMVSEAYSYLDSQSTSETAALQPVFVLSRSQCASGDLSELLGTPAHTPWQGSSLNDHYLSMKNDAPSKDIVYVILDAAASPSSDAPGWGVRNVIALLSIWMPSKHYNLLCLRGPQLQGIGKYPGSIDHDDSILMRVTCVEGIEKAFPIVADRSVVAAAGELLVEDTAVINLSALYGNNAKCNIEPSPFALDTNIFGTPSFVGWETNERGKPGPRLADLGAVMNSEKLMEQAVDLNVRLMRWRQWPSLDTESLSKLKCLLLGAGTLGCATARALMGWGIRHITFVDNGRVSYSNPARQSLFEFEDAENKAFKSVAAAQRLKKIFPGMVTAGHVMTIAMPGHPIDALEEPLVMQSFEELKELIASHDVVYALTDSREARWLPSLLCAAMDKLLINSALGFSTYLVMRHGGAPIPEDVARSRPGCYFCNDVVAPVDSMKDRSLDQQCTVTRPGLALIAAGLVSELTVALMNSPLKMRHPLPVYRHAEDSRGDIGDIPHQIRGSLDTFTQSCPVTSCFTHCTACSQPVVDAYNAGGYEFIRSVCSDSSILEQISGITALNESINDELLASMELDSDEDMDISTNDGDADRQATDDDEN